MDVAERKIVFRNFPEYIYITYEAGINFLYMKFHFWTINVLFNYNLI